MEYIKGILVEASPEKAILEVQGIGYRVFTPLNLYGKLPQMGSEVCLYLSVVIREDSHKKFGFLTQTERDFFEKLIEISGIGPKLALALLGHMEIGDLRFAIAKADINLLSKIPGVGKKTAERLVVELRGKMSEMEVIEAVAPAGKEERLLYRDALSALMNLGYNPLQAQKAIKEVFTAHEDKSLDLSLLITKSLQKISR